MKTYREAKYCDQHLARKISELLDSVEFDAVWVGQLCMAHYVKKALLLKGRDKKTIFVLDQHNEEVRFWNSFSQTLRNPLLRLYSTLETMKNHRQQRQLLPLFDYVLSVSEEDRLNTLKYAQVEKVLLCPNGVDHEEFTPAPGRTLSESPVVVFGASLDVTMNQDGILWFLDHVLPLIHKRVPVAVHIVGRRPPAWLLERVNDQVKVHSDVPDVKDYYRAADAFIVPLLTGGGTKLKTLEALSLALPVVTTSVGAQGLNLVSGTHCLIADSAQTFADSVVDLVNTPKVAQKLGMNGRTHVIENYGWSEILAPIENLLSSSRSGGITP